MHMDDFWLQTPGLWWEALFLNSKISGEDVDEFGKFGHGGPNQYSRTIKWQPYANTRCAVYLPTFGLFLCLI